MAERQDSWMGIIGGRVSHHHGTIWGSFMQHYVNLLSAVILYIDT